MLKNIKNSINLKGGENMELKVKEEFRDKYTGEIYQARKNSKGFKRTSRRTFKISLCGC